MTRHRGVSICRFRFLHGNLVFNCTVLSVQREYNTVQEELFYIYGPLVLLPPLIYDLGINYRYFNYYDGYSSRQQLGKSIVFVVFIPLYHVSSWWGLFALLLFVYR